MFKLIGFEVSKGEFTTEKGEKLAYNNRIIKCITNEERNNLYGFDFCEFKVKAEDVAKMLGCVQNDEAINSMLDSCFGLFFEPKFTVIKGKPVFNGFDFYPIDTYNERGLPLEAPETSLKSMSEIVEEKRSENKKEGAK